MKKQHKKRLAKEFLFAVGSFIIGLIVFSSIMIYASRVKNDVKSISAIIKEETIAADSLSKNYLSKKAYLSIIGEVENDSIKKYRFCKLDFKLNNYDSAKFENKSIRRSEFYVYRLYEYVKDEELYHGSFDDFKLKYSDTDRVNFVYKTLYNDGHYCMSKFEFYEKYFPLVAQKYLMNYFINQQDSINYLRSKEINVKISELKKTQIQNYSLLEKTEPIIIFAIKVISFVIIALMALRYVYFAIAWSIKVVRSKE